jgi:hypothetical protein
LHEHPSALRYTGTGRPVEKRIEKIIWKEVDRYQICGNIPALAKGLKKTTKTLIQY